MNTNEQREAVLRKILGASLDVGNQALAREVNLSHQMVYQIRVGTRYRNILPDLPRIDPDVLARNCTNCALFTHKRVRVREPGGLSRRICGYCTLGIPEADGDITFGRACGAYVEP